MTFMSITHYNNHGIYMRRWTGVGGGSKGAGKWELGVREAGEKVSGTGNM